MTGSSRSPYKISGIAIQSNDLLLLPGRKCHGKDTIECNIFFRFLEATGVLPANVGTALLWDECSTYGFSSFTSTRACNFYHTDIEQRIGSVW